MSLSQDAPLRSVAVLSQTAWWRGRKLRPLRGKDCHIKYSVSHLLRLFFPICFSIHGHLSLRCSWIICILSVSDTQAGWERAGVGWVRRRSEYIAKWNCWNNLTGRRGLIRTWLVFVWLNGVYLIRRHFSPHKSFAFLLTLICKSPNWWFCMFLHFYCPFSKAQHIHLQMTFQPAISFHSLQY